MPNTRSAAKQARKSLRKRAYNLKAKKELLQVSRQMREKAASGTKEEAVGFFSQYQSVLDRLVKRGRLTRNAAARRKQRVAKALFAPSPSVEQAAKER
ncbi:MAG: 30S ribosomal protein S20 [Candidatus Methylacidiphilaceae bacterium]